MHRQHELRLLPHGQQPAVERHPPGAAAALAGAVPPGVVDDDEAHGARHHAVEVRAALPVDRALVVQAQIRLVDQADGIEGASGRRLAQLLPRHLLELLVRQLDQRAERARVARAMLLEKPRQIAAEGVFHGARETRSRRAPAPKEPRPPLQPAARTTGRATSLRRRNHSVQGGS
jgi:hypothetical protein